jgi:hypothetical protein
MLMENWQSKFQEKINELFESNGLDNFSKIRNRFDEVFSMLTSIKDLSNPSIVWIRKTETKSWYYVYHYALILQQDDDRIAVFAYDESSHPDVKEKIAEIYFKDEYTYLKYTNDGREEFLSSISINKLFKIAFAKLID